MKWFIRTKKSIWEVLGEIIMLNFNLVWFLIIRWLIKIKNGSFRRLHLSNYLFLIMVLNFKNNRLGNLLDKLLIIIEVSQN
jgi:hypothetical protein